MALPSPCMTRWWTPRRREEFGLELVPAEDLARRDGITSTDASVGDAPGYDAAILAVAHRPFVERGAEGICAWLKPGGYLYDVKYAFGADEVDARL